jgi:hypothetical protein
MTELLIVHEIPGRIRLRVPADAVTEDLREGMLREPGVVACTWSPRTRSLLVRYRGDETDVATVTEAVARLTGVRIGGRGISAAPPVGGEAGLTLDMGLRKAARVLDQRVQRVTRGTIGLSGLIPVALFGWALAEIARGRTGPLAWSTALWYAHGLYRDYSVPPSRD